MVDRNGAKTEAGRSLVADWIARAIYAYAGRTGRVVGHASVRKGMALLPARTVERITQALCREFAGNAGPQPSRRELERLAFLYGVFPQDPNLIALTFRVNVYPDTNARAIEHLLARITPNMDRRDDLNVVRMFYIHKTSPGGFDPQQFRSIAFDAIRQDVVLADIWRILFIKLVLEKAESGDYLDKSAVKNYLEIEGDPNVAHSVLYKLFEIFARNNELDDLAAVVAGSTLKTSVENFAIAYFFLVSFGFEAHARTFEAAHRGLPNATLHPMAIKGRLAPRPVSAIAEDRADRDGVDPAYAALAWAWRDAELQKAEIRTRLARRQRTGALTPGDRAKPHMLVAFFGQMRFPESTVPGVRDWILNDFAAHAAEVDLTFAVSTWRETGSKVFLPDDHIDTSGVFLTPEVVALLKSLGCCTLSDIRAHCPRVVSRILDQTHVSPEIDESQIGRYFPGQTYFDVDSEAGYMRSLGRTISDAVDGDRMLLNQGRMISRIGSVARILANVDRTQGAPTHVLFIRPDLCDLSGSLARVFQQMKARSNWAVVDQDAYAQVVEGVGDRFILADRSAADQIAGIGTYTRRIFDGVDPESVLRRKRLRPHQMLRSLMFEASIDIHTVSRGIIGWNLFRGAVNQEAVLAELRVDVSHMTDGALRDAFTARL